MINRKRARAIASDWYNGQWSALYKIACNETHEKLSRLDWHDAYFEAAAIGRYDNVPEAKALMVWIKNEAKKYGHVADGVLV